MSKNIDILKLKKYKVNRLNGQGKKEALLNVGYKNTTASHRQSDLKLVKVGEQEIAQEIDKRDLVNKAYKTLQENLSADKASDRNTAAIALLDFNEGKKSNVKSENINPNKIIIAYGNKDINNRIPQDVVDESKQGKLSDAGKLT